jgi:hypothetical protein
MDCLLSFAGFTLGPSTISRRLQAEVIAIFEKTYGQK